MDASTDSSRHLANRTIRTTSIASLIYSTRPKSARPDWNPYSRISPIPIYRTFLTSLPSDRIINAVPSILSRDLDNQTADDNVVRIQPSELSCESRLFRVIRERRPNTVLLRATSPSVSCGESGGFQNHGLHGVESRCCFAYTPEEKATKKKKKEYREIKRHSELAVAYGYIAENYLPCACPT